MTTWLVSRHPGAIEWIRGQGITVDRLVEHLDIKALQPGDSVIGTLPVNLVAEVCDNGGRYYHLTLDLPPQSRGRELSADDMRRFKARIEPYRAWRETSE